MIQKASTGLHVSGQGEHIRHQSRGICVGEAINIHRVSEARQALFDHWILEQNTAMNELIYCCIKYFHAEFVFLCCAARPWVAQQRAFWERCTGTL